MMLMMYPILGLDLAADVRISDCGAPEAAGLPPIWAPQLGQKLLSSSTDAPQLGQYNSSSPN
jgi:hypothetical protein